MAISEQAQRTRADLLGGGMSPFASTDPELVDVVEEFVFGEVPSAAPLDPRVRLLTQLASTIAGQALSSYRELLEAAVAVGIAPVELREVVYQAVPYVGMAKVRDFLQATNETFTAHAVPLPLPSRSTSTPATRLTHGLAVQARIVGADPVQTMHANAPDDEVHIQRFLSANCFGDHVGRAGLDLAVRELLTFSMLISMGGCEPQAKGHVAANLRVGNDRALLIAVVTHLLPLIGYPRTLNALGVIDEAAPSAAAGEGGAHRPG